MPQDREHRSGCPINLSLELLGDSWSLLIIRDLMFGDARHFRELLRSQEGIASSMLAERLRRLTTHGLITSAADPTHQQKTIYSLTEMGIQLVPVLVQLGSWGRTFLPASDDLSVRIEVLERGGPRMWRQFMDELRHEHLGQGQAPGRASVRAKLETAYEAATRSAD